MDIGGIIKGHTKEAFGISEELKEERLKICKQCPLYVENKVMGPICSPYRYYDPETGDVRSKYKSGYLKGCGCRLNAKTRLKESECPVGKWGKQTN